jgi:amino-acid N-acetyltransferase
MALRLAHAADVPAVHALIAHYAAQGLLLPRSEPDVRTHLGRFLVVTSGEKVVGCAALEPYGKDLAEIRSLAVSDAARGGGVGGRLMEFVLVEARRRGFARVFAITHAPRFFERHGFAAMPRYSVPEKIERDCRACPKQDGCEKVAMVAVVAPERATLHVLRPAGAA